MGSQSPPRHTTTSQSKALEPRARRRNPDRLFNERLIRNYNPIVVPFVLKKSAAHPITLLLDRERLPIPIRSLSTRVRVRAASLRTDSFLEPDPIYSIEPATLTDLDTPIGMDCEAEMARWVTYARHRHPTRPNSSGVNIIENAASMSAILTMKVNG